MPIDLSAAPTPPPARKSSPTAKAAEAKIAKLDADKRQRRIDGVNSIASAIHMGLLAGKQSADAAAVNRHAPGISLAIVDYADGNEKFGASLDKLSDVSPIAGIVMAVAPLVLQISVNHGLFGLKAEQMATAGVVTKQTLESETTTYLMDIQTKAMQREMEAKQNLIQTHADFMEFQKQMAAQNAAKEPADDDESK